MAWRYRLYMLTHKRAIVAGLQVHTRGNGRAVLTIPVGTRHAVSAAPEGPKMEAHRFSDGYQTPMKPSPSGAILPVYTLNKQVIRADAPLGEHVGYDR